MVSLQFFVKTVTSLVLTIVPEVNYVGDVKMLEANLDRLRQSSNQYGVQTVARK
jgi:hypothetical protein